MKNNKVRATVILILVLAGIFYRTTDLGNTPGINGDEAWYGVWAQQYLKGEVKDLTTPTGNPINIFYMYPLIAFEYITGSTELYHLRVVSWLSGMLLLVLSYFLTRKSLGKDDALLFALLLCCLPHLIAYCRFGWDASQVPLFTLLCVYFSWSLRPRLNKGNIIRAVAAALSLWAAILVHPTCVFLLPLMIFPLLGHVLAQYPKLKTLFVYGALVPVFIILLMVMFPELAISTLDPLIQVQRTSAAQIVGNLQSITHFWDVVLGVGRLMTGVTILQYIVGNVSEGVRMTVDGVFVVSALALMIFGVKRAIKNKDYALPGYLLGLLTSMFLFYLVAGNVHFTKQIGNERHTVFFLVPALFLFIQLLKFVPYRTTVISALSVVMLIVFQTQYMSPLKAGENNQFTFHTAEVEPKQQVYEFVKEHSRGKPVTLGCDFWWSYQSVAYLSSRDDQITAVQTDNMMWTMKKPHWLHFAENPVRFKEYLKPGAQIPNYPGMRQVVTRLRGYRDKVDKDLEGDNVYFAGYARWYAPALLNHLSQHAWEKIHSIQDAQSRDILFVWKKK